MSDSRSRAVRSQSGASMLELMLAMSVISVATLIQVQQMSVTLREYHVDQETQFASRKAADMLAELQAAVDQGAIGSMPALQAFDDVEPSSFLTTRLVPEPDHVMSGNSKGQDGDWTWWRDIDVEPIEGVSHSRYVRIKVLHADASGRRATAGTVSGLLNVTIRAEPTVQEYDVYALAIAEAPSLWQPLPSLRAEVQGVVDEIAGANPNLRFRLHWITSFGYGRDPLYVPYVNEAATAADAAPWVYWYPGRLAPGGSASTLYSAEMLRGRVRTEAGVLHDFDSQSNPYPHAIADRMNHCVRTEEARELFALRVAAGTEKIDEPPLQLLLADMAEDPDRYQNAIVLNLHGGGLPFPALRNYSDAAKDPEGHPEVRVVTHPARLHTLTGTGAPPVEFRVYAYKTTPTVKPALLDEPITLQIFGGDFTSSMVVERQAGGVCIKDGKVGGGSQSERLYSFGAAKKITDGPEKGEMNYEIGYSATPAPHTWVRFHNTPLLCPVEQAAGVDPKSWLYGTDYCPSPVTNLGGFYAMSNATTTDTPKNTVRWRVQLSQSALTAVFGQKATIVATTRIGTDLTTGRMWPTQHQPGNVSTTYAWWSTDPEDVPLTERYQFQGDPRHNPYIDLCVAGTAFAHGYNWWFDDMATNVAGGGDDDDEGVTSVDWRPKWTAFDTTRLRDGFGIGVVEDVPRMMQVWRQALQASCAVLVNPGGRLGGHLLLGGEIVLPADGAEKVPVAVALHGALYGQSGTVAIDDLSAAGSGSPLGGRPIVRSGSGFWAKPWLGELSPDTSYSEWSTAGNLATSSGFARQSRGDAVISDLPRGSNWEYPSGASLTDLGGGCLLQAGAAQSTFVHTIGGFLGMATLSDDVYAFSQRVGLATARTSTAKLPFTLTGTPSLALPTASFTASFPLQQAQMLEVMASSSDTGRTGAGVIRVADPGKTTNVAFFVPMAATPRTAADHHALAYRALVLGLRALYVAGEPARSDRVPPLPIVQIDAPEPQTDLVGDSAQLRWSTKFLAFSGQPYTQGFPPAWSGSEASLAYVVTWRRADETQWYFAVDDEPVVPGELTGSKQHWILDAGDGSESWALPMSSKFTTGEYVLRIDCFRQDAALHAAHHEVRVQVRR